MITDLLKDSDVYEKEHAEKMNARPHPKFTIHTLMGDMKRWYDGDSSFYSDYKIDERKYEILLAYYNEKEGIKDENSH